MVVDGPLVVNSRTMLRPENPRTVGQLRYDDSERPRTFAEHTRVQGEAIDMADKADSPPLRPEDKAVVLAKDSRSGLSPDETLDLFQRKAADAKKDTEQALEREGVTSAVSPKLTLDLGHCNIACLPVSVVDLIKDEVDRLSLSHNQISSIPPRFSDCTHLRYLNIRSNLFRDIPKAVYKLPLLEILDISRNKVRTISPQISNLTSLRVFALASNRVEDLPTELCEMKKLQMLKIADNPLRLQLKRVIDAKDKDAALSGLNENERETIITSEIKKFLAKSQPAVAQIDTLAAQASSEESLVGTPKPTKRAISSRFPVIPSNISSGDTPNEAKSSPIQATAPPLPARSHFRISSGQGLALKRPALAPLIGSNERNRSNSESFLQATGNMRTRRMGMLTKSKPDLDSIEESKANRNSHLRGFSHASVLKRGAVAASPAGNSSSSPNSPREPKQRRQGLVKKLSSLPEHRTSTEWDNPIVQGAKGILYALYQIHPQLSGLIAAIKKDSKRTSLEITFYASSTHVDRLNDALEMADSIDPQDEEAVEKVEAIVQQDCETCVMAYTHVFAQLQDSVRKIVAGTDPRYVRTLMLLLYGSILEIRNAINTFGFDVKITQAGHKRQKSSGPKHPIQTIPEEYTTPLKPARFATPTQDGFNHRQPGQRFRSDTAIQHPIPDIAKHPPSTTVATPIHLTGSTVTPDSFANTSSTYTSTSFSFRSRSHSRNASQTSTALSSAGSTPRSVDAFHLPRISPTPHQINPITGLTDAQEEAAFSPIYLSLTRSFEAALQAIPPAEKHFKRCLQDAKENHRAKAVQELWVDLAHRCKICFDASEALRLRLTNMNMKGPYGGRNDPSFWLLCKTFLQSFVDLVTEMREARNLRLLPQELILVLRPVQKTSREAGRLINNSPWRGATDGANIIPAPAPYSSVNGAPHLVRNDGYSFNSHNHMPNSSGSKDSFSSYSSTLTQHHMYQANSPFPPLPGATINLPTITTAPAVQPISGPGFPTNSLSTSYTAGFPPTNHVPAPHTSPLPSTPLSAALGPAAQATVPTSAPATSSNASSTTLSAVGTPSTPATGTTTEFSSRPSTSMANSNDFFKGDVFQRADSLLNMPQPAMAGGVNFFSVRR